ncbi:MAG: Glutamyl-tRNA synthetase [uncultured Solirubrobacterales bacterium]|uniref:Glutamate--tRNA ligase n=1 Tax=uncultured Solirubrobacterales bacterium TaxID=768556 RepID=A0A6J4SH16_9ACTN|nr:MAG: Glutamyl-tRNA synthetase [uncultured Solirubrobacterales bacterium]
MTSTDSMRVRFAPSPTGALHIGGARTALYNWLLARGSGGKLVLRIEDTDRERSTPENVAQILDALEWLGLGWDEGPLSQAERGERHREEIARLVREGYAYEDEGAVRLRVPEEGATVVRDVIRGEVRFEHSAIDDFVIARSDGSPLYNLAVAVDDRDMGITHVVRGEDHLSNTPRQLMVLRALGAEPGLYAHLPLLHGPDGKKLSKRHGAASVQELREGGYLPEAVRNYLALLGWGADATTTFFTTEDLVERFSLERVSRNPAVFDEQKLRWMNGRYLRELEPAELARRLEDLDGPRPGLATAAAIAQEKMQTLADFFPLAGFLVERRETDERAWRKVMRDGARENLTEARHALAGAEPFDEPTVEAALRGVVERRGVKPKEVFQPVRVAISGSTVSPGIFESVVGLGREETLARVDDALGRFD